MKPHKRLPCARRTHSKKPCCRWSPTSCEHRWPQSKPLRRVCVSAAASGRRQPAPKPSRPSTREADRLTNLVSNLLDLGRLEGGAWNPSKDWCDLTEIVGTALDRVSDAEATRIEVHAAEELPLVRADYVQIALVLTNLLQNALKYTSCQRPNPCFTPTRLPCPCRAFALMSGDYGEGITPGDEDAIWNRFYRSARHTDSTVHGTGLGLSLCRAVIDAHGGRIWARNVLRVLSLRGRSSRFGCQWSKLSLCKQTPNRS